MIKRAENSEEVITLDDNDEDEKLETMEENNFLEMKITEKETLDMIMEDSDNPLDYKEMLNHTQKRRDYERPIATTGKRDKMKTNEKIKGKKN